MSGVAAPIAPSTAIERQPADAPAQRARRRTQPDRAAHAGAGIELFEQIRGDVLAFIVRSKGRFVDSVVRLRPVRFRLRAGHKRIDHQCGHIGNDDAVMRVERRQRLDPAVDVVHPRHAGL